MLRVKGGGESTPTLRSSKLNRIGRKGAQLQLRAHGHTCTRAARRSAWGRLVLLGRNGEKRSSTGIGRQTIGRNERLLDERDKTQQSDQDLGRGTGTGACEYDQPERVWINERSDTETVIVHKRDPRKRWLTASNSPEAYLVQLSG